MQTFVDLKKRLYFGVICSIFLFFLLLFSSHAYVKWIIFSIVSCISLGALWEYIGLAQKTGAPVSFWTLALLGEGLLCTFSFVAFYHKSAFLIASNFLLLLFLLCLYHLWKKKDAVTCMAIHCFAVLYIIVPFGLILCILYPRSLFTASINGQFWCYYLLVMTKGSDISAYFWGRLFSATRKLSPYISPQKTVAGMIGSCITMGIFSMINALVWRFFVFDAIFFDFFSSIVFGVLLSLVSQSGDLTESLFKRDVNVKNSNEMLPEIGGVLDVVDSMLFTTPLMYCFLQLRERGIL